MTATAPILAKTCPKCQATYTPDAEFCATDGARLEVHPTPDPYVGMIVSGDIELKSLAGVGAMGSVYRAHQRGTDRDVAVKLLHRELSANAQLVHRFHREAKIASKLRHPHVVEVYLADQLPDGTLYIVMEYLDGCSLAATLARDGAIPLQRALGIALQIADAVGEAHTLGIVHRDLKPDNVMLVRRAGVEDWVKVLDFGIARLQVGEQSMETAAGRIFGTARYMSPEGAAGGEVGAPADVYAMATMLYEMLAGRTPFEAPPLGLLIKHLHEPAPPLLSVPSAAGVPPPIARVVMDNLAKPPEMRAQTGRAFAQALVTAARDAGILVAHVDVVARADVSAAPTQLEPTLNDAGAGATTPGGATAPARPTPTVDDLPVPSLPLVRTDGRRGWLAVVAVAFAMGIVLTLGFGRRFFAGDTERAAYVERTRRALSDGHYVAPPGENVEELVARGLQRWPNDADLGQLRSDAEHEMVTMAMAAHASGDLIGARDLARDADRLDPTDNSARYMRAQAEDDLAAIASGEGLDAGPPRLVFEAPPVVKTGAHVDIKCRIVAGSAGAKARIGALRLSVLPNGATTGGTPVKLTSTDPANVRAELTAAAVGSWDVTFEAAVDGTFVRAMRDLDVVP